MSVAAIVLAAGRGARFDAARGKLLADYRGCPLARHAVRAALASKASKTIVVTGHARGDVEQALAGLPVNFAHNPDFASGVASSLRVGLARAADSAGALILLADMPAVGSATLDQLIAAFERAPGCAAVAPVISREARQPGAAWRLAVRERRKPDRRRRRARLAARPRWGDRDRGRRRKRAHGYRYAGRSDEGVGRGA